ncbi:MAG TPA: porin family protein [Bradyrhizobium sp.]|nr:porin family protein [Bradyrhizobium sp.]
MKKLLLALTAAAAVSGSAFAADLPARTYTKAPPPIMAPSWTGFYIFGGGGGGIWKANTDIRSTVGGACLICGFNQTQGGDGWLGTAGIGYDWQVNPSWVVGVFGDGQWGSLKGTIQDQGPFLAGRINNDYAYAAGVRVGYLVAPNVLSYVNGGWSGSHWKGTTLFNTITGGPTGTTNSFDRSGWFVGGGVENNLNIFGITAPGWFMKTEYRSAFYDTKNISEFVGGVSNGRDITFKPWVQTITTSIVYRFNWSGPVVAKY